MILSLTLLLLLAAAAAGVGLAARLLSRPIPRPYLAAFFVLALLPFVRGFVSEKSPSAVARPDQWSRLKIESLYESWQESNGTLVNDVISLDSTNFKNQTIANPHVQSLDPPLSDWTVLCYGDNNLGDQSRYDAIYALKRQSSNGRFVVPGSPVLAYPTGVVGFLGAGAGVTKTPVGTSGTNYRYFAVVTAEDRKGTPSTEDDTYQR